MRFIISYQFLLKISYINLDENRIIAFDSSSNKALVASCCTLIGELILRSTNFNIDDTLLDKVTATLLLSIILLDSINLDINAKKVTERDIKISNILESYSLIDKNIIFNWLQNEKFNPVYWENISFNDCLLYDYKQFKVRSNFNENYELGLHYF